MKTDKLPTVVVPVWELVARDRPPFAEAVVSALNMDEISGINILSNGAIATVCALLTTYLKLAHDRRVKIERVDEQPVTKKECKERRCEMQAQIQAIIPALQKIETTLKENDRKSEERAINLNRRIDPLLEKVAANMAESEIIKKMVIRSNDNDQ